MRINFSVNPKSRSEPNKMKSLSVWYDVDPKKQFVQRSSKLTTATKLLDQKFSNFYSSFPVKLSTTFVFDYFADKQLKLVEKFVYPDCSNLTDLQGFSHYSKTLS
jgi:hypothetical protein